MGGSSTVGGKAVGRSSAEIIRSLRRGIASGKYAVGSFLPSVRQLAADLKLAPETARRALKSLEAERLVAARPGSGYQVLPQANDPLSGCPMAYVSRFADFSSAEPTAQALQNGFQHAAGERGWSTLGIHVGGSPAEEVADKLRASRAWGVALDVLDDDVIRVVKSVGVPTVMVNAWHERAEFDAVLQDNYRGGYLAAAHLVSKGCRRIAWLGPVGATCHSRQRYAGAVAALAEAGVELAACAQVDTGDSAAYDRGVESLLTGRGRADGLLCLWADVAKSVKNTCDRLKLVGGQDFAVVGWSTEEFLESTHRATFSDWPVPPAITWSLRSMVQTVLQRLAERRQNPDLEPLRVSIPARLRVLEEGAGA